jgi:hypothetical protein
MVEPIPRRIGIHHAYFDHFQLSAVWIVMLELSPRACKNHTPGRIYSADRTLRGDSLSYGSYGRRAASIHEPQK